MPQMPDFLRNLRMQGIFGPQQPTFTGAFNPEGQIGPDMGLERGPVTTLPNPGQYQLPAPTPYGSDGGGQSITDLMGQMYTPETQASERFNQMIQGYPERPDDQGWLRKIAAIGLGTIGDMWGPQGAGNKAFEGLMYPGYSDRVREWKDQIGPAQQAASLERQTNVNERTMAYQTAMTKLREEAQAAKEANDTRKAEIAQQRANVYEFMIRNPNMKIEAVRGGNIMAINPRTGEVHDLGVSSGLLSDLDRITLQQRGAQDLEGMRQTGRESLEGMRQEGQKELEGIRQTGREALAETRTQRDELPTQTRIRQYNTARELVNTDPDLKPFIKVNDIDKTFDITPVDSKDWLGRPNGPTPAQFKKIQDAIYGMSPMSSRSPLVNPNEMMTTKRNKQTGEIITVFSDDGGKTWYRKEE